jgi:phosphonate transport system substrate-binding protein
MIDRRQLLAVSYLAPNWFSYYQAVTTYLAYRLNLDIRLIQGQMDPLEDPFLLADKIDLTFICGLPFFKYQQIVPNQLQGLVAPVMQSSRYENQPVYFSDVIVNVSSAIRDFAELRGKVFCYNDLGSNSGFYTVHRYLQLHGYIAEFMTHSLPTGSHQNSIRWIVEGRADWAAIDSTVWEQELQNHPSLAEQLRVITAIGPSLMPPIVAATHLGSELLAQLQSALLHPNAELQAAMRAYRVSRYAPIHLVDYQSHFGLYQFAF